MDTGTSPETHTGDYESSIRELTNRFDVMENDTDSYDGAGLVEIHDSFATTLQKGVDEGRITALGRYTYLRDISDRSRALAESASDESTARFFEGKEGSYKDISLVLAAEPASTPAAVSVQHMSGRKK